MHRKVAVAIVAALALAVASCGGSETTTLTKAQLVRRVETACRTAQTVSRRAQTERDSIMVAVAAGQRGFVDTLEDLEGSGSAKDDFATYKDAVRSRYEIIKRVAAADRADQSRVLASMRREVTVVARRLDFAARDLGIEGCF